VSSRTLAAAVLVVAFVHLPVGPLARQAFACDCDVPTVKESLEHATAIFTGKVIKVEPVEPVEKNHTVRVTIEVDSVWKGEPRGTIHVFTPEDGGACGYGFEPGQTYLVYAKREADAADTLTTDICTRTRKLSEAGADLKELGDPAR
jgi:hypothetical protein